MTKVERARTGREVALRVLARVTTEDAWASRVLDAELSRSGLSPEERGLATELSYGTLRLLPRIDAVLAPRLKHGLTKTDAALVCALRLGVYQLVALDRIPDHAAVSETVSLVRALRGQTLAGVANAVLRGLLRDHVALDDARRIALTLPVEAILTESLGAERLALWRERSDQTPPLTVRVRGDASRDAVIDELRMELPAAELAPGTLVSSALHLRRVGDVRSLAAWRHGALVVQDEGSQWIAESVEAAEGDAIVDVCAGHGGKTLALLDAVGKAGRVVAMDLYEEKLEALSREAARLGKAERLEAMAVDLSVGTGGLARTFDRVLVDAPCTGLGTLLRRPEIGLRVGRSDPRRLAGLQLRILANAATLVRDGGILVYAVCSPTTAEGADVAAAFLQDHPEFEPLPWRGQLASLADTDGLVRLGPWSTEGGESPDLYQIARWRRRASPSGA